MGRGSRVRRRESGQSTVEYALVLLAFLSSILALGVVWRASRDGLLASSAREGASHVIDSGIDVGLLQDVTAF